MKPNPGPALIPWLFLLLFLARPLPCPGEDGGGSVAPSPPVLRYRCSNPRDGSFRYWILLEERVLATEDGGETVQVRQRWAWACGRASEIVDTLRTDPVPGRALITWRREWDARGDLFLEESVHYPADPESFPPDAYPYTSLFTIHRRGLEILRTHKQFEYHAVFPGGVTARLVSRLAGTEPVRLPGGPVECYKVRMNPDMRYFMGAIGALVNVFVRSVLPDSTLWYSVHPPHTLIRYEGLSAGEQSVYPVVYELDPPEEGRTGDPAPGGGVDPATGPFTGDREPPRGEAVR